MGYSTCYCLQIRTADNSGPHPGGAAIIAHFLEINEIAEYALDEEGSTNNDTKWYDHDADLMEFS